MAKQRLRGTYVFPAGGASQANVDKTISEATKEIKSVVYKSVAGLEVESNKTASVTANGTLVVEPSDGKDVMEKATVTVAVPLEVNKTATIDASQYATPVEITPSDGKTAMQKATVTVTNIPVLEANKTATITQNGTHAINPSSGKDGMEKATITVNVSSGGADLEDNKTATIDVSEYTEPVEITPTAGKDGMKKATVTLSNIPSGSVNPMVMGFKGWKGVDSSDGVIYIGFLKDGRWVTDKSVLDNYFNQSEESFIFDSSIFDYCICMVSYAYSDSIFIAFSNGAHVSSYNFERVFETSPDFYIIDGNGSLFIPSKSEQDAWSVKNWSTVEYVESLSFMTYTPSN